MDEYIKRKDALSFPYANGKYDHTNAEKHFIYGCETYKEYLAMLPASDVRPVVYGKWIMDEDPHDGDVRCSHCLICCDQLHERNHKLLNVLTGNKWWEFYKFCPECGADMRPRRAEEQPPELTEK